MTHSLTATPSLSLFGGDASVCGARERPSPKGDLELVDWMVPVHYLRRKIDFPALAPDPESIRQRPDISLDVVLDALDAPPTDSPETTFVGRDGVFFGLERACLFSSVVLVWGPGGVGKTELVKAFARWRAATGATVQPGGGVGFHSFEPGVASFGLAGVVDSIGLEVFGPDFSQLELVQRRAAVVQVLRENPFVVIWDNFESVHSMPDLHGATPALDEEQLDEFREFLRELEGGASVVLVTSRSTEAWLGDVRRVELEGLRGQEMSKLAEVLLAPFPQGQARRSEHAFGELLEWLGGHPLSMRVILPQLESTTPKRCWTGSPVPGRCPPGSRRARAGPSRWLRVSTTRWCIWMSGLESCSWPGDCSRE